MELPVREPMRDRGGSWTREWYCVPPQPGTRYVVLQQEWSDDYTVQRVYEIELPDE